MRSWILNARSLLLYRLLTAGSLGAAAIGVVLPLVPTVPFLLLAAWSAARHSPELERRLLAHPRYGPALRDWRAARVIPRRAKISALLLLSISLAVIWLTIDPPGVRLTATAMLGVVAAFLATRPETR